MRNKLAPKNIKEESLDIVVQPDLDAFDDNYYDDSDSAEEEKTVKKSTKDSSFTCTFCHKILRTKKGLKIHQRKHTGEKLHGCQICQAKFTKTNHLVRHMKIHNKNDSLKHTCKECGANFPNSYLLIRHKKVHNKKADESSAAESKDVNIKTENNDNASEKLGSSNAISNGIFEELDSTKMNIGDDGMFPCNFCGKVLTTHMGLRIHMRRHTGHNLAKCEVSFITTMSFSEYKLIIVITS